MEQTSTHVLTCVPGYGASEDDWFQFDLMLGLGPDLLPVVANPQAEISETSSLKDLGKTPSRYNSAGKVAGILGWTNYQATPADIAKWLAERDYGICLQTRRVRALDIDVPDADKAGEIEAFVGEYLDQILPCRTRANSGKRLLAFLLPGELGKRKMVVDGGIIEFLATGQQFVAVGTHPSGARYRWIGGLPAEFPVLDFARFEALWQALAERFATEPPQGGALTRRMKGASVAKPDPVADHLQAAGLVLGQDRAGSLLVACPWEHEHTTGRRGDGSTVWFPAGSNGYQAGHFKCLHGHCIDRNDGDFFGAIGYSDDLSEDFEMVPVAANYAAGLPFKERDKAGKVRASRENLVLALSRPELCDFELRFDSFQQEVVLAPAGTAQWRSLKDSHYVELALRLERSGKNFAFSDIAKERLRDVVAYVAETHEFDTGQIWLNSLEWDGIPRVELFLRDCFGAEDTDYARAVSLYLWTALAGRVMKPGCKADMVPVAVGPQGAMKSSTVAAIVPSPEHFLELDMGGKDDDMARLMRGKLVIELGELKGLRARESEQVKAFITRQYEEWVPKYREMKVTYPRRCVFIGTTNNEEFLQDRTGHRRWLPFQVTRCNPDRAADDRLQLWAEARDLFCRSGVQWRKAEELAYGEHEKFVIGDPWEPSVEKWLNGEEPLTGEKPCDRPFTAVEALTRALGLEAKYIGQSAKDRMAGVLKSLGFAQVRTYINGRRVRAYVKGSGGTPWDSLGTG
jgi:predicted P-loop ATPase